MDGQELLAAIVANPEDDARRLVYADWLLRSGDRLGELIVAQLEQAASPDNVALKRRVAQLISALRTQLVGDLPLSQPVFRRGFIVAAEITAAELLELGERLFERLPLLTELIIWLERHEASTKVCASPLLGHLRELEFRYARGIDPQALAANPHLAKLERLGLTSCELKTAEFATLAASSTLGSLRTLAIGSNPVEAASVAALAKAKFAPSLTGLRLWKAQLSVDAVRALRAFEGLRALDLSFNKLGLPSLGLLGELSPSLRSLTLRGVRFPGPEGVSALAPLTLGALELEGALIGDAGVARLDQLDLSELETLDLSGNRLTRLGLKHLLALPLPKLRRLNLRSNELGRSAKSFARKLTHTRVELDEIVLPAGR